MIDEYELRVETGLRVLIQLGSFHNIDIYQRGYYQLSCRLYAKHRRLNQNPRRIDGIILNTFPANELQKKEDQPSIPSMTILEERTINHNQCTQNHKICTWRCKANHVPSPKDNLPTTELPTKYVSGVIYIQQEDDDIPINSSIMFGLKIPTRKLTTDLPLQEDALYLDIELFFISDEKPIESIYNETLSKKNAVIKINNVLSSQVIEQQYYQIEFDDVYQSSCDLIVSSSISQTHVYQKRKRSGVSRMPSLNLRSLIGAANTLQSTTSMHSVDSFQSELSVSYNNRQIPFNVLITPLTNQLNAIFIIASKLFMNETSGYNITDTVDNFEQSLSTLFKKPLNIMPNSIPLSTALIDPEFQFRLISFLEESVVEEFPFHLGGLNSLEYLNNLTTALSNLWIHSIMHLPFINQNVNRFQYREMKINHVFKRICHKNFGPFQNVLTEKYSHFIPKSEVNGIFTKWPWSVTPILIQIHCNKVLKAHSSGSSISYQPDPITPLCVSEPKCEVNLNWINDLRNAFSQDGKHLIVFVHGFLGSNFDFRRYKNQLFHNLSNLGMDLNHLLILYSESNEKDTTLHIATMGHNLAIEVATFIRFCSVRISKISFVAHSLGGLIVRMAIRHDMMSPYRRLFQNFTTIATPHFSSFLHSHLLMSSFLSVYQSFSKSDCIDQLYMKDHIDLRQCLIYHLSQDQNINYFQSVNLFGCPQDLYVHFEGALAFPLFTSKDYSGFDADIKTVYKEMINSFERNCKVINRYVIYFDGKEEGIGKDPLGRWSHVAVLENQDCINNTLIASKFHCI
ncbi:putative serine esterase-domain-containing protein [Globomyces pollinis-pini]|nr:putative serine esterase-domain-containing protein [Globomyces pollinis-pini]